jgi:integrase/recombinase XerD
VVQISVVGVKLKKKAQSHIMCPSGFLTCRKFCNWIASVVDLWLIKCQQGELIDVADVALRSSIEVNYLNLAAIKMKTLITGRVIHDGAARITIRFPYDPELIKIIKRLPDACWSRNMGCWHIQDRPDIINLLLITFKGKAYVNYSAIRSNPTEKNEPKPEVDRSERDKINRVSKEETPPSLSEKGKADVKKYRRWMEANRYPESTVQTYTSMMVKFLRFVSPKEAEACTSDDLTRMIEEVILPRRLSHSFQNQMISSVKKFYSSVYRKVIDPGSFTRPRPIHRLPNALSKDEVKQIINALTNEKHRVMLSLIYACGLRRSELLQLVPSDIERSRNLMRIRQSKGFRDRIVPISDRTIEMVSVYMQRYKPERFIFEGQVPGEPYSPTSLEKVLKSACDKAGIVKPVTLHWLRHSYATHLLESGTDLRYIQELLGHKSSKTTEIYTHVTTKSIQKIRSPFDEL